MNFDNTIIIPMHSQANFLMTTLKGLIRHSRLLHRILVVYSRPEVFGEAMTRDSMVRVGTLERYQEYQSVPEVYERHTAWCDEHHIEFHDITESCISFRREYEAGRIYPGGIWSGGQDTAFKDNLGLRLVETEFVVNNWDADFYPGPGWDVHLVDVLRTYPDRRVIAMPVHVQPSPYGDMHQWTNIFEDTRHIACNRPIFPLPTDREQNQVYDHEWVAFVKKWQRQETIAEACGVRDYLHWVPTLLRTVDARRIGEWGYKGSGYDLEMDDRCGQLGYYKVCPRMSFIMHKGFVADEEIV